MNSDTIKKLLAENKVKDALTNLNSMAQNQDEDIQGSVIMLERRYKDLERSKVRDLDVKSSEENKLVQDILNITEQLHQKSEIKEEHLHSEDLTKIIDAFSEKTDKLNIGNFDIDSNESHELYNMYINLKDSIFEKFDEKISKVSAKLLFEKILYSDNFRSTDIELITKIRKDKSIKWYERVLVVYALTISIIRKFDIQKIDILLDFLFDNEDEVWEVALTGLFLGLYERKNRIEHFPEIYKRIENLNHIPKIRDAIFLLSQTFEVGLYKYSIIPFGRYNANEFVSLIIQKLQEYKMLQFTVDKLLPKNRNKQKDKYLDIIMNNYAIKDSDECENYHYLGVPHKWFIPFFKSNEVLNDTIKGAKTDIKPNQLIFTLENLPLLSHIEKYNFCINVQKDKKIESFIPVLSAATEACEEVLKNDKNLKEIFKYNTIVRSIYLFFKYYPKDKLDLDMNEKMTIYNSGLYSILLKSDENLKEIVDKSKNDESNEELINKLLDVYIEKLSNYIHTIDYKSVDYTSISIVHQKAISEFEDGNFERAENLFTISQESDYTKKNALIGLGHIHLCKKDSNKAKEYYLKAKILFDKNKDFISVLQSDYHYLESKGINRADYDKMINSLLEK